MGLLISNAFRSRAGTRASEAFPRAPAMMPEARGAFKGLIVPELA